MCPIVAPGTLTSLLHVNLLHLINIAFIPSRPLGVIGLVVTLASDRTSSSRDHLINGPMNVTDVGLALLNSEMLSHPLLYPILDLLEVPRATNVPQPLLHVPEDALDRIGVRRFRRPGEDL